MYLVIGVISGILLAGSLTWCWLEWRADVRAKQLRRDAWKRWLHREYGN